MSMFNSWIGLNDLPDEILIIIFKKLNNYQVLYSLQGVNKRLNNIVYDSIFTSRLSFVKWLSYNFINLLSCDLILDRFCLKILPSIHENIKWLDLESSSMKHVLQAAKYPNLVNLGLYNINQESSRSLFTDKTLSSDIFKNQITALFLTIENDDENFDKMLLSVRNICNSIFTVFTRLITLIIYESSYKNRVRLLFEYPPQSTFRSSTLRKLNIRLQCFDDCLYLLDGRFNQLHTLIVDLVHIRPPEEIKNQGHLPNLKYFSLTCYVEVSDYEELILPLLYRMSNLEQLGLYLPVYVDETFIDTNHLKENIINHMSRLNQFTFYIRSFMSIHNRINFPSKEDIQCTFNDFSNNKIICYVDYYLEAKQLQCHIYSYPSVMQFYGHITNNFPGGLFNNVRAILLYDEHPFEHEFFLRIQKSFPFMENLTLINHKSQNHKQSYESNNNIIEYSSLSELSFIEAHDDYIEQFLFDTKTFLKNNVKIYINYESLERVTHNFTRDVTRINCAKINRLHINGEKKCSNSLQEYFRDAKIIWWPK